MQMKKMGKFCFFVLSLALITGIMTNTHCQKASLESNEEKTDKVDESFFVAPGELTLAFSHLEGARKLSFQNFEGPAEEWKHRAQTKLAELLGVSDPAPCSVTEVRKIEHQGVTIHALVMTVDENLSIPGYLLVPKEGTPKKSAVMAIHGHGRAEPCVGSMDDYHHLFALELAKAGHLVICPELRGFGALRDLAAGVAINRLDYWIDGYSQFTLVTDGFLYDKTLIGETVEDLLRWEKWLVESQGIEEFDVAGISYGGDLSIIYPVFTNKVRRIFASGTMGSFSVIFKRCYNAPAHCIPGILEWMDRSDIAGLNAPRPIAVHYGELDTPSPTNASASYNETVPQSMQELGDIYREFGGDGAVELIVTPGKHHEMDIPQLLKFLGNAPSAGT
jgi:pimeloyl-ACP methyl ester carboxylesterase